MTPAAPAGPWPPAVLYTLGQQVRWTSPDAPTPGPWLIIQQGCWRGVRSGTEPLAQASATVGYGLVTVQYPGDLPSWAREQDLTLWHEKDEAP